MPTEQVSAADAAIINYKWNVWCVTKTASEHERLSAADAAAQPRRGTRNLYQGRKTCIDVTIQKVGRPVHAQ